MSETIKPKDYIKRPQAGTVSSSVTNKPNFKDLDAIRNLENTYKAYSPSYATDTFHSWKPNYPAIITPTKEYYAQYIPVEDIKDRIFIGSLPLQYPYSKDTTEVKKDINGCPLEFSTVSFPQFCGQDNIKNIIKDFFVLFEPDEEDKKKGKWKVIKEITDLADELDKIPEPSKLTEFLSVEYAIATNDVKKRKLLELLKVAVNYEREPIKEKVGDYEDLSAYLNAPFPKLDLPITEENPEVQKLIDELDKLGLEDLNIPLVQVNNCDLTERQIGGDGVFDIMMDTTFNQLLKLRKENLVTQNEIAEIYKAGLVQNIQVASQFTLEKANILNQSYATRLNAVQASVAVLQAKAQMLMLPVQIRTAYAQLEAQLKQLELLKIQIELEKEKFPQVVAQTDLILAQTDGQRLGNEQAKVGIQQSELSLVQIQEQIALAQEQNKQAKIATESAQVTYNLQQEQLVQAEEQSKTLVLNNNHLIEQTKQTEATTRGILKDIKLKDSQLIMNKAQIKLMGHQLEKEQESLSLVRAQTATALAQLALVQDQKKASEAQYSDTIDGKPVGGLLGAQILVNKVQASSFERKAYMELLNSIQTGWGVNKTSDIAIASPTAFTPLVFDRVAQWGFSHYFNMPDDIMQLPVGYTPYLGDDEMDGKDPVTTGTFNKQ